MLCTHISWKKTLKILQEWEKFFFLMFPPWQTWNFWCQMMFVVYTRVLVLRKEEKTKRGLRKRCFFIFFGKRRTKEDEIMMQIRLLVCLDDVGSMFWWCRAKANFGKIGKNEKKKIIPSMLGAWVCSGFLYLNYPIKKRATLFPIEGILWFSI